MFRIVGSECKIQLSHVFVGQDIYTIPGSLILTCKMATIKPTSLLRVGFATCGVLSYGMEGRKILYKPLISGDALQNSPHLRRTPQHFWPEIAAPLGETGHLTSGE